MKIKDYVVTCRKQIVQRFASRDEAVGFAVCKLVEERCQRYGTRADLNVNVSIYPDFVRVQYKDKSIKRVYTYSVVCVWDIEFGDIIENEHRAVSQPLHVVKMRGDARCYWVDKAPIVRASGASEPAFRKE